MGDFDGRGAVAGAIRHTGVSVFSSFFFHGMWYFGGLNDWGRDESVSEVCAETISISQSVKSRIFVRRIFNTRVQNYDLIRLRTHTFD